MKRLSLFLWGVGVVLLPAICRAQWSDVMANTPAGKNFTGGVYSTADFASNSVTSMFATYFLLGDYLDDHYKQQVTSKLRTTNRIGATVNYGIYGVWYNDTIKQKRVFNLFFALRHKSYVNAGFTADAFKLAFYGNAIYAGETAHLSPFSYNNVSYQQAELGVVCTNFGNHAQFGAGVSFLAGQRLLSITARNATLYTDYYGQYLQFSSDADYYQSDSSAANRNGVNGYGASLDLYFKAPYKIGKKTGTVTVTATDLGFLWWNNKSLQYHKDTSYYYDGVTIANISDLQNVSFNSFSKDSLQNKYVPFTKKAFYYTIPATITINSNTSFGKYHIETGFWCMFNSNALGYYYLQGDKYLTRGWMTALQVGYGGYGRTNAALMLTKQSNHSTINIAVNHLQGIVDPMYYGGAGFYVEYIHTF